MAIDKSAVMDRLTKMAGKRLSKSGFEQRQVFKNKLVEARKMPSGQLPRQEYKPPEGYEGENMMVQETIFRGNQEATLGRQEQENTAARKEAVKMAYKSRLDDFRNRRS